MKITLREFIENEKGLNRHNLLRKFIAGFLIVNSFGKINKKDFGKTYDEIKLEYVSVENSTEGIPTKDEFVNKLNELLANHKQLKQNRNYVFNSIHI